MFVFRTGLRERATGEIGVRSVPPRVLMRAAIDLILAFRAGRQGRGGLEYANCTTHDGGQIVSPISKIRAFAQRNDRHIAIISGLLLLMTFIFKEIVRENVKESKDSLAGAENTFRIRSEFRLLHDEIKNVDTRLRASDGKPHSSLGAEMTEQAAGLKEYGDAIDEDMENITDLALSMSFDKTDPQEFAAFLQGAEDVKKSEIPGTPFEAEIAATKAAADKFRSFDEDLMTGKNSLLEEVRAMEKKRERNYRIVTWMSYFLFLAASAIGLTGKLMNIKGVESE
jgi:hypothetical protein